jgi:hypothetical protein
MQKITGIGPAADCFPFSPLGHWKLGPCLIRAPPYQVYTAVLESCHVDWKLLENLSNLVDPNMTCLN